MNRRNFLTKGTATVFLSGLAGFFFGAQKPRKKLPENLSKSIRMSTESCPDLVVLEDTGDIYVRGYLIENDKELVDAFREFLTEARRINNSHT